MRRRKPDPLLARWTLLLVAFIALLMSIGMALPGAWLAVLGGSFYYLIAGAAGAWASWLILRGRHVLGVRLFAVVALGTLLWSLWEISSKAWMHSWGFDLAGRVGAHTVLLLVMTVSVLLMRPRRSGRSGLGRAVLILGVPVILLAAGVLLWLQIGQSPAATQPTVQNESPAPAETADQRDDSLRRAATRRGPEEWTAYGGSNLGQGFSTAAMITPDNVANLKKRWEFQTGDEAPGDRVFQAFQNTPLKIDDSLYLCSSSNQVFALNPSNGHQQWHFDPEVSTAAMELLFSGACRTLGYHQRETETAALCAQRILVATVDSRLIALDAQTGELCADFGDNGTVDLSQGMGSQDSGLSVGTSGPVVVGDLVIVGQQINNIQRGDAPSGVTRAYDATTGELVWVWDAWRTEATRQPPTEGETWPRGTPAVWTVMSADETLGLVYLATGNSTNDHWGGNRAPEEEQYASAVVALDAQTGATRWHYRTVDHDLWNYDLGAQPTLTDLDIEGETRRVVIQGAKTGAIFVLDARTGEPLTPIERRAAPQGTVDGDWTELTQPHSTAFPNFAGAPGREAERIDESHVFGLTPLDALFCRIQFNRMRYEGIFTPPSDKGAGTLLFPGTIGGLNWGGVSVNPEQAILITNNSRLANRVQLSPPSQGSPATIGEGGARPDQPINPQAGAPYTVDRPLWFSPLGVPCIAPPWGYLSATDLRTGRLLWTHPLGTGYDTGPMGIPTRLKLRIGTPNLGGSVNTRSGLTFIAAAQDNFLRAFNTRTGELLWEGRLPAGGQATPMTYTHNDRQYVAVAAGGHARLETDPGDSLVVFALPEEQP
ncbi:hypothetical protein LCGC14_0125670 [marine sediment metagenome]|uniref:Pyrrolo-quinoline quinone repeat domain-containing protein n=1 Tax=marine sediment metagenome TaxID=412755 RepID=A0A0F9V5G9_9ZZZZ